MISIPINHVKTVIAANRAAIDNHQDYLYAALSDLCNQLSLADELDYVHHLLGMVDRIITAQPNELDIIQAQFEGKISGTVLAGTKKKFRDRLLKLLDYNGLRSTFYPQYFHAIGIKSCVYCNAMLTVSVERTRGRSGQKYRAKFQADHYHSKTSSPCLSVSLFNLYPVCANCNLAKGIKKVTFKLYQDIASHRSPFSFSLKTGCKAQFILKRDISLIEFGFTEPAVAVGFETFNALFDMEGLYKTQIDIAEELLLKAEAYTDSYKAVLRHRFKKIFVNDTMINRLLIGNYTNASEIHKRPLAKFTRDIAIDIGLLPKDPV